MADAWDEKAVFLAALSLAPEDRGAFLRGACPDDASRERIEALLRQNAISTLSLHLGTGSTGRETPDRIEEFHILHKLGEGGMGVVYLAEDTVLGRRVALKILAGHLTGSEQALSRFKEEARNAALLKHPAIVPVFRFGYDGRCHYIVSEYVDGYTLHAMIADERVRRAASARTQDIRTWHRRAAEIVATVADALDYSHLAGIVHRDVKPSNILVEKEGRPRLTDFGIAKHFTEEARTRTTDVMGSCHYMSPEQASIARMRIDQRSDIFSLGVVLYELLALKRPFDGKDIHQVLRAVATEEPTRLRKLERLVSKDLETICHKAIEKDPERRYQTAAHMAADLRCTLQGRPILATPPGYVRRCSRWLAHHRLGTAGAATAALAALCAILFWQNRERRLADLCNLTVLTSDVGAQPLVAAMRWDTKGSRYGELRGLGTAPLQDLQMEPGYYRFVVDDGNGKFADFDEYLTPSRAVLRIVTLAEPAERPVGMVQYPGGVSPAHYNDPQDGASRDATPNLDPFWLDVGYVTNRQYKEFVAATGRPAPKFWEEVGDDDAIAELPVVDITREEMQAFALWAGKRLPTVYEWFAAAQAPDAPAIHWNAGAPRHPAIPRQSATGRLLSAEVGQYLTDVRDAVGIARDAQNAVKPIFGIVIEMTSSIISKDGGPRAVVTGGYWAQDASEPQRLRASLYPLDGKSPQIGFRCARSVALPAKAR